MGVNIKKLEKNKDIDGLIKALKDENNYRWHAAEVLGKIGKLAVEPLITTLKGEDWDARCAAASALGEIGDTRAVEPLIAVLKDENSNVRMVAAKALGEIKDARAVESLVAMLKDKDEHVRFRVAEALGKIEDARAIDPLISVLKDEDRFVRQYAAESLGKIGDARAVEPLITVLKNKQWNPQLGIPEDRRAAEEALVKVGKSAITLLIEMLNDKDCFIRGSAAKILNKIGWEPTSETAKIAYLIADIQWDELVKIGKPAIESLIEVLRDKKSLYPTIGGKNIGQNWVETHK